MNLDVTRSAITVLRVLVMLRPGRLPRADIVRLAVARQTQLVDRAVSQQPRIRRSVRRMAGHATFSLHRSVLESERALLVRVALETSCIAARYESGRFEFKSPVRIVAITATHGPFHNFVVKGRGKCRLNLSVATHTELRVVRPEHSDGREARLFGIRSFRIDIRTGKIFPGRIGVRRVTVGATNIVAPVFTTTEVVPLFLACMAGKTRFSRFFR